MTATPDPAVRLKRSGSLLSVLGLVAVAGALLWSTWTLSRVSAEVAAMEARRGGLQAELAALADSIRQVEAVRDSVVALASRTAGEAAVAATVQTAVAAYEDAPSAQRTTVFAHVPDARWQALLPPIEGALRESGYYVPAVEVVRSSPDVTSVRYFSPEREAEAERIARALRRYVGEARAVPVPSPRPLDHVEVWIGKDARPTAALEQAVRRAAAG